MRIGDFIELTNKAADSHEVFAHFLRAVNDFGYDRTLYCAVKNHPIFKREIPAIARNYPDDWMQYYTERNYAISDPARLECAKARGPFSWKDLAARLPKKRALIFAEAESAGIKDGVAVPIHGPGGEAMAVGLASSAGGADGLGRQSELHLICVQFHTAYCAFTAPDPDIGSISLTPRELEVLNWCMNGKSAWAIGEIMKLSEDTIEWHMKNIFRKLGVSSKITAVVKALHLGLISLLDRNFVVSGAGRNQDGNDQSD